MLRSLSCIPAVVVSLLIPGTAGALEIRQYLSARHDRFTEGASGPQISTTAYYNPALYTAVGYATNPGDVRQFALVTPEHVLFARHFASGGLIRFMNTDGAVFDRSIISNTDVPNGLGGISDLVIMKISAPIGKVEKISPVPYLNLSTEAAYLNMVLTTFGQSQRAGRGVIEGFLDVPSGIDETRTFSFTYKKAAGNRDDAYAVTGDSGSPTFALANGRPALVGVHLAASQTVISNSTFDTFIPHYAATVNGLLAPEGYQLIPTYPKAVTLSPAATHAPLRQTYSGSVALALSNTAPDTATNVRMELVFPSVAVPSSLSASGWIVENPAPGIYLLRSATLAGNASSTVTPSYASIPVVTEISFSVLHRSDGSPELSRTFDLPVQPTFAGFVAGLDMKAASDDPDLDGFSNLIEYAFGGDPGTNSAFGVGGQSLSPTTISEDGTLTYSFPRRIDAAQIGLTYEIGFSETLEENSWSATTPPGFTKTAAPYEPDIPGFEKVTATFPTTGPDKRFVRVNLMLSE